MGDQVKIYDSVRGTEWLVGRGYGTVTGASMKKSSGSWSNVFTTWKKKGKSSDKKTCREAFSLPFSSAGMPPASSVVMNPHLDPAILKFCSLSAASGHHYLSNGNYKFSSSSGSPACDPRCQQVPCMSVRGASSSPASISQSPSCCSHPAAAGRRGSLFAAEWETHHQDHSLRCTCHHATLQSARTPVRPQLTAFTSRYTPSTQQRSSGVTDVHGTADQLEPLRSSHSADRPVHRLLTSPPANNKNSSSSASPATVTSYKKSGKQSSTISGSFIRSLRRSAGREPFNSVSGRKSILNTEVTAYDLIRHEFDQEEESDNELFVEELLNQDGGAHMQSTPKHQKAPSDGKNRSPALVSSSKPKSEYLSKNMRIGGQGVTLFSWEESLHKSSAAGSSTPSAEKRHQRQRPERVTGESGIPAVILEEEDEDSVSSENILLPEPDYDLSDEDDAPLKSLNLSATLIGGAPHSPTHRKSPSQPLPKHDSLSDYEIATEKTVKRSILKRPLERSEQDAKNCSSGGGAESGDCSTGSGSGTSTKDARSDRTKYRKSALNCMMKLKFNKRNHRKHVTFRSYKDDSLILEHINEPIPEEDETLYDDVASDPEEEDDHMPSHENSIREIQTADCLSSGNVIQIQLSGKTHSAVDHEEEPSQETPHREDLSVVAEMRKNGCEGRDEPITTPGSDCAGRREGKVQQEEEERSHETDGDVENDSQTSYVDPGSEPERETGGKPLKQVQRLDQISEDEEEECDNGNEYYDHFPDESSQKHAFTIAFYNSLGLKHCSPDSDGVQGGELIEQEASHLEKPEPAPRRMSITNSNFQPLYKSHANSTSKSNKIIIDVPPAGAYESVGQQHDEHIYEELVSLDEDSLTQRSMFDGASRDQILEYLEDAKERVKILITSDRSLYGVSDSYQSVDPEPSDEPGDHQTLLHNQSLILGEGGKSLTSSSSSSTSANSTTGNSRRNRSSNVSNSSTDSAVTTGSSIEDEALITGPVITRSVSLTQLVERNDSGVGTETSKPAKLRRSASGETEQRCTDCDQVIDAAEDDVSGGFLFFPVTCNLCDKKRSERKEIISEFVDTELKYGRDLRVIKEEFYRPMEVAGLMTKEQLKAVFINLDELMLVNSRFSEKLVDALEISCEQGDEDYASINLGRLFQGSSGTMLHAFETYCSRQGTASLILTQLEKEKELLRIFLRVSQMENTLLRRMNLSAFLMVPVQRVTKYPLLLNRLYKVTPAHHQDREALRTAQQKVELHLEHINQQTKATPNKIWKRISNLSVSQRRLAIADNNSNIKLRKIALDALRWNREEAQFALCGRLTYACISESHCSNKARGKTSKFLPVHALLVTLGQPTSLYRPDLVNSDSEHELACSMNKTGIKDAALVLVREKNGRFTLCRDPFDLKGCIVSTESEEEAFEVQELLAKESYMFKAELNGLTCQWYKQLSYHSRDLGGWRKRRNALSNIMMGCR